MAAQTSLALFFIATVPIAGGSGTGLYSPPRKAQGRGRGWERGFVTLSPFLLRVTFAAGRFPRPVIVLLRLRTIPPLRLGRKS